MYLNFLFLCCMYYFTIIYILKVNVFEGKSNKYILS